MQKEVVKTGYASHLLKDKQAQARYGEMAFSFQPPRWDADPQMHAHSIAQQMQEAAVEAFPADSKVPSRQPYMTDSTRMIIDARREGLKVAKQALKDADACLVKQWWCAWMIVVSSRHQWPAFVLRHIRDDFHAARAQRIMFMRYRIWHQDYFKYIFRPLRRAMASD